ncbi:ABC transporter permease subunit [candidate division KSB3 bacterium]|uniref:ABC transporter permease subunit n=1 Tax=candidate division KSB3 bacterium TaxID=2044937 RepID=A0A9D5Q4M9_9BACT|nr:ABC transporter permease subunit [candidate division KSB3 bacterium]MBD3323086.1 ABC transporter permease subunit [candidate division KSB3 bacterium]
MQQAYKSAIERRTRTLYLMLAPALIVMVVIIVFPLFYLFRSSLMKWELTNPLGRGFIGMANFVKLAQDTQFYHALGVTAIFVLGAVLGQIVLALIMAEILNVTFRGRNLVQSLLILPMVIAPIVVGVIWKMLYNPNLGVVNYLCQAVLGFKVSWLGTGGMALLSLVIVDIWQWTPFVLLMFLASYSAVPPEFYEAADVDGANRWQKFAFITFPMILPMIIFALLFRMTEAFKVFPKIFIMTMGGPGFATETLNFYTYRQAFTYTDIGYSSTLGVAMLAFSMILIGALFGIIKRTVRIGGQ